MQWDEWDRGGRHAVSADNSFAQKDTHEPLGYVSKWKIPLEPSSYSASPSGGMTRGGRNLGSAEQQHR